MPNETTMPRKPPMSRSFSANPQRAPSGAREVQRSNHPAEIPSPGLGASFIGENDQEPRQQQPAWQRYVDDRMHHFTISSR